MVKQGDIIRLNFDPQMGTEQMGIRPALVVSGNKLHLLTTKHAWVCPITNTDKDYPIHIRLAEGMKTTGVILCDQLKTVDLEARGYQVIETAPDNILWDVLDIINDLLGEHD